MKVVDWETLFEEKLRGIANCASATHAVRMSRNIQDLEKLIWEYGKAQREIGAENGPIRNMA